MANQGSQPTLRPGAPAALATLRAPDAPATATMATEPKALNTDDSPDGPSTEIDLVSLSWQRSIS